MLGVGTIPAMDCRNLLEFLFSSNKNGLEDLTQLVIPMDGKQVGFFY
jgi:hypothetical protein